MPSLTSAQRRYLWLEQGVGSVFVNFALNAAFGWTAFRSLAHVPLWGVSSIAGDTIATCFLLPLLTTVIVSALTQRALRAGRLEPLETGAAGLPLPGRPLARGLALGALCVMLVFPLAIAGFFVSNTVELSFPSFVLFKGSFAAVLGLPLTPLVAWAALADGPLRARRA
jgi:hypothetical protein